MFTGHFYHAITRKSVAVFGTLFNNISVVRKDKNGNVVDFQKVPLAYGPRQKFLTRIDEQMDLNDPKVAIKLPRMSFEITNLQYDSAASTSIHNKVKTGVSADSRTATFMNNPVPYIIDMQLNIMAKNQDDALQILEQILPTFRPSYTLSVKFVEGAPSVDVPITLQSVMINDEYEGDFNSRRVLMYTIDFSMKVRYFGDQTDSAVITKTSIDFNNLTDLSFMSETVVDGTGSVIEIGLEDHVDDNDITP